MTALTMFPLNIVLLISTLLGWSFKYSSNVGTTSACSSISMELAPYLLCYVMITVQVECFQ